MTGQRWLQMGGAIALMLLLPLAWAVHGVVFEPGPSGCAFKAITGQDCIFCGLTRAFSCMMHGEWHAAFGYNPCWPLALLLVVGMAAVLLRDAVLGTRLASQLLTPFARYPWLAVVLVVGLTTIRIGLEHW